MPKYTTKPYPAVGQIWQRVDKRYFKEPVFLKIIVIDRYGKVCLEVINLQYKQKMFPVMRVETLLHGYIFVGREL